MPDTKAITIEYAACCLVFLAIFLAEAAGSIRSEFISRMPTQRIDTVTTTAISNVNAISALKVFMPLLAAKEVLILVTRRLLYIANHNRIAIAIVANSIIISISDMPSKSPMRKDVYLLNPPHLPIDKTTTPNATDAEEKTPIIVSGEEIFDFFTKVIAIDKITEKIIIDHRGCFMPAIIPTAMPVSAECPMESEKNAILLLTTIVPNNPKSGVASITAKNAFFIKVYCIHEKGSILSKITYMFCSTFISS